MTELCRQMLGAHRVSITGFGVSQLFLRFSTGGHVKYTSTISQRQAVRLLSRRITTSTRLLTMEPNSRGSDGNVSPAASSAKAELKKKSKIRPSSCLLLFDPLNRILLVQRSAAATMSFSSAHVFPGGKLDASQDVVPEHIASALPSHMDALQYQMRLCAIRETFEETGILLVRRKRKREHREKVCTNVKNYYNNGDSKEDLKLAEEFVDAKVLEDARRKICTGELKFLEFLDSQRLDSSVADLLPLSTWITPREHPKRYHTKMYLGFLPKVHPAFENKEKGGSLSSPPLPSLSLPTGEGGEIITVTFLPPHVSLQLNKQGKIILFPPQFYLLTRIERALASLPSSDRLTQGKRALIALSKESLGDRVIEPYFKTATQDERVCLALDKSGSVGDGSLIEDEDSDKLAEATGDEEHLILVRWSSVMEEDEDEVVVAEKEVGNGKKTRRIYRTPVPSQLEVVKRKEFLEKLRREEKARL